MSESTVRIDTSILAELGHHAAADAASAAHHPTPRTLPAPLDLEELQKILEEVNSAREESHIRAVVGGYHWKEDPEFEIPPASATSSMAVSISAATSLFERSMPSSRGSAYIPSLAQCSTAKSESSVHTSRIGSVVAYALDEDEDGVAVIPQRTTVAPEEGKWACLFDWLNCDFRSDDLNEWDTHCKSHLRGHLPKSLRCAYSSCRWRIESTSGEDAWTARTQHIVDQHSGEQGSLSTGRPDPSLLEHMLRCDVIDRATYKELRLHGRLPDGYVFTTASGPVEERRRERRQDRPDRGLTRRR